MKPRGSCLGGVPILKRAPMGRGRLGVTWGGGPRPARWWSWRAPWGGGWGRIRAFLLSMEHSPKVWSRGATGHLIRLGRHPQEGVWPRLSPGRLLGAPSLLIAGPRQRAQPGQLVRNKPSSRQIPALLRQTDIHRRGACLLYSRRLVSKLTHTLWLNISLLS